MLSYQHEIPGPTGTSFFYFGMEIILTLNNIITVPVFIIFSFPNKNVMLTTVKQY